MTLQDQIQAVESDVARELLQGLYDEVCGVIHVSGEWLPKAYRDQRRKDKGSSLARVERKYQKNVAKKVERQTHRDEIKRRVELYAAQWEKNETLEMEGFVANGREFSNAETKELF